MEVELLRTFKEKYEVDLLKYYSLSAGCAESCNHIIQIFPLYSQYSEVFADNLRELFFRLFGGILRFRYSIKDFPNTPSGCQVLFPSISGYFQSPKTPRRLGAPHPALIHKYSDWEYFLRTRANSWSPLIRKKYQSSSFENMENKWKKAFICLNPKF